LVEDAEVSPHVNKLLGKVSPFFRGERRIDRVSEDEPLQGVSPDLKLVTLIDYALLVWL